MMQFCIIYLKSRQKRTIRGKSVQFFLFNSSCWHLLTVTTSLTRSRYRKKRVSVNHHLRKGLTLDSDRERPPDQHEVVLRVANSELWYTFQNTVTAFLSRCKRG